MKDLFETPELLPTQVREVLENVNEDEINSYPELERLLSLLKPLGYTFDYYLDAEPYGLRPIGVKLNELEGWEDVD